METIEKLKWIPVWLIMFSLIFTSGSYFYKQSLLVNTGDEYLRAAANKGKFTTEEVENLIDDLERLGFDRSKLQVTVTPAEALDVGVSKDDNEYIELIIDTNQTAYIARIFSFLTSSKSNIKYHYRRIAKSEEYID